MCEGVGGGESVKTVIINKVSCLQPFFVLYHGGPGYPTRSMKILAQRH